MSRHRPLNDHPVFHPLKTEILWILLALADRPRHGYGILVWIREQSGSAVDVGTGQLYRHLKRMLDDDWVGETVAPAEVKKDDERRRYYRLTSEGRRRAEAETRRLAAMVRLGEGLGLLPETGP